MSDLKMLIRSLGLRQVGAECSVNDFRMELDLGQVPDSHRGGLFGEACQKGYLIPTGRLTKANHRAGKGRLVRTYKISSKARDERGMS